LFDKASVPQRKLGPLQQTTAMLNISLIPPDKRDAPSPMESTG